MYQPKLRDDLIPRLYRLGKALDVPMTGIANVLLELGIKRLEETLTQMGYTSPVTSDPPNTKSLRKKKGVLHA